MIYEGQYKNLDKDKTSNLDFFKNKGKNALKNDEKFEVNFTNNSP